MLLSRLWDAFKEREQKESTTLSLRRDQLALENFLREAMSQGLTKTDITLYCCMNGWSDLEIEDSWEILSDENDG